MKLKKKLYTPHKFAQHKTKQSCMEEREKIMMIMNNSHGNSYKIFYERPTQPCNAQPHNKWAKFTMVTLT